MESLLHESPQAKQDLQETPQKELTAPTQAQTLKKVEIE